MPRWLHLGLGAFHRAHQAAVLQRLRDAGDRSWTLAAGNVRGDAETSVARLRAQVGAYTLETISPQGEHRYERIDALQEVVPWDENLRRLIELAADPQTTIISFTVTEGGYALPQGEAAGTWHAALGTLLGERLRRNAGPVTLLSCDNLRHNGDRSRQALLQFLDGLGDAPLRAWVEANTTSPNCMVDRITPRLTAEVVQRVRAATGIDDPCAVMAESYLQWVIEDRFAAGRPALERAGVQMTDDVAPYEEAKIRLLNATHSVVAWAGTLRGHAFIHEGVRDAAVEGLARACTNAVIPLLTPSPLDLAAYRDSVLERFGNAAIRDTNQRVASGSFAKVPAFIAPTVNESLARGRALAPVAMLAALFLAFLQRWDAGQLPYEHEDAAMDPALARGICRHPDAAGALARVGSLWGDASTDPRWASAVRVAHAQVLALVA
ncbi:mannitol dehydrogenase family protein [Ramlibacter algicola]|uniref:Mannitol dehydrogenase family protein n=1 Tax=Ramlibacter algicola TaxID=2795217 RepID=A0A934USN6_9BURK|nr:mannitol dehydrogenase family protein [Ramlibacter algicola]MBK0394450.1 mannitol dehydrogenase family protein [Ramlibacter algicola]